MSQQPHQFDEIKELAGEAQRSSVQGRTKRQFQSVENSAKNVK